MLLPTLLWLGFCAPRLWATSPLLPIAGSAMCLARPAQTPFRASVCAARTLNATGQSRVTLYIYAAASALKRSLSATTGAKQPEIRPQNDARRPPYTCWCAPGLRSRAFSSRRKCSSVCLLFALSPSEPNRRSRLCRFSRASANASRLSLRALHLCSGHRKQTKTKSERPEPNSAHGGRDPRCSSLSLSAPVEELSALPRRPARLRAAVSSLPAQDARAGWAAL